MEQHAEAGAGALTRGRKFKPGELLWDAGLSLEEVSEHHPHGAGQLALEHEDESVHLDDGHLAGVVCMRRPCERVERDDQGEEVVAEQGERAAR